MDGGESSLPCFTFISCVRTENCVRGVLTHLCSLQNVRGTYLVTRAFLPLLLKGGDKTIVNLSSVGAHTIRQGASGYQTTKLAITRFTEHIMSDYGEQGILAWSVHPGGVMTELASKMPKPIHSCKSFIRSPFLSFMLVRH